MTALKPLPVKIRNFCTDEVSFRAILYNTSFESSDPLSGKSYWLEDINPESELVVDVCLIEGGCKNMRIGTSAWLERTSYFTIYQDSLNDRMVLNKTIFLCGSR